jgi:hypothetical protein
MQHVKVLMLLLYSPAADPEASERDVFEDQQASGGHQRLQDSNRRGG